MSETMNRKGGWTISGTRGQMIRVAAAVAVSLCGVGSAFAIVPSPPVTWDATGTADYNIGTNWNPDLAGPPANTDNQFLTINNGATATINNGGEGAFLILGLSTGQSGNLVINGGTSTFGELRVGGRETVPDDYTTWATTSQNNGGTGTVIQNPGTTVNITYRASDNTEPPVQSMYVGDSSGLAGNTANGSYTINGTAEAPSTLLSGIADNDAIVIGTGLGTVGTFTQNAFTSVTSTGFINIGRRGSTGTYNMNGGTLTAQAGSLTPANVGLYIGDGDNPNFTPTSGTFNQTGGTVSIIGQALIGRRNGVGTYNISAGSFTTTNDLRVPDIGSSTLLNAQGNLNVSGTGVVTVGTNLNIGLGITATASNVVGTLTQTGGSVLFTAAAPIFAVGNGLGATGTVNQSGGTIDLNAAANTGASNLSIGRNNASGTYNLSGTGVLNAKTISMESTLSTGTASRILNVSGGTLTASAVNFGTAIPVGTATRQLNVSGGNVTIGTLTTGNNGLTYVSGGTFSVTTLLSLTSTSTLRTSIPLTLNAAQTALGTMTIQVDSSTLNLSGLITGTGSLTKTGAGTLMLSGSSTTTAGSTTVSGGKIKLSSATARLSPGNVTVSGAALGTALVIDSGVANGIANTATLSLGGGGTVGVADQGYADLGSSVNERVAALLLAGSPQSFGLTYGSLASAAAVKSDEYFAGTGIVTVGTAGDYNNSGAVDAADYVTWRQNPAGFGGSAGYDLWRQNFGNVFVPGAGTNLGGNQAVPEPSSVLLAVVGILMACVGRRRR